MKQWNEVFKKQGKVFLKPQEGMAKIVNIFKKHRVKKVLDLSCGTGRHLVYLAKNDFDVYGIDIAEDGIKIAKKWLKEENLKANLKIGSIYKRLPYKDNFFDAIISTHSLHHERINNIRKAILETERILKTDGLIFITFRKRKARKLHPKNTIIEKYSKQESRYKIIDSRTYIPIEGIEKGLPHYLFNKELIKKEFHNFRINNIWVNSDRRHYYFVGIIKT